METYSYPRSSKKDSSIESRLLAYSAAAAGAAIALAPTSADAQVVYRDINPDIVVSGNTTGVDIDINNDGTAELSFVQTTNPTPAPGRPIAAFYPGANTNAIGYTGAYFYYANALNAGDAIGPAGPIAAGAGDLIFLGSTYGAAGPYGPWAGAGQTDKYLGIQFQSAAGVTNYAWLRLDVAPNSGAITIKDLAYQSTPDAPIIAGNTGTATEPDALAEGYLFSALAPNPATSRSAFTLAVGQTENVRVEAFDALGRSVSVLQDGPMVAGQTRQLSLDASNLPAGVYVVRVTGESFQTSRRVTVAR